MGAGGDSLTSRRFDAAEVEASAARPSRNVRRRSRLAPTGGKALARRTTSYERIANLGGRWLHYDGAWRVGERIQLAPDDITIETGDYT